MKNLSKPQKILSVMFDLSDGRPTALQYEDIVVAAFERFREDFQLRGYPQYPDSSDIHKPLYKMKQDGLVRSANKTFALTPMGLEVAGALGGEDASSRDRLTKPEEGEIARILTSQALQLFQSNKRDAILDTDFYEYLGVSVRTPKADFMGRLNNVRCAIAAHREKRGDMLSSALCQLHEFLLGKFKAEISARQ